MPNWTWWQYLFLGYLIGAGSVTLCAWLFGHKKAPDDAATSEPEQTKIVDPIILRHAEKVKRKMRGDQR